MNNKRILIKGLLRKMESNDLSEKEVSLIRNLKRNSKTSEAGKLSKRELNRAVKRNKELLLKKRNGSTEVKKNSKLGYRIIIGSAAASAAIILALTLYNYFLKPSNNLGYEYAQNYIEDQRYSTEKDLKEITLPDGSTVFMNRETSFSLRKESFNEYTREVWLDEGEAFFNITKDESRPFIVHTSNGISTQVLGTSFNIKSYSNLRNQVISVNTGRVQVINKNEDKIILDPNYKVTISNSAGQFELGTTDAEAVSDWRSGRIVFENAPISEVAFRIKQVYNLEMVYDETSFGDDFIYTFFTTTSSIDNVLTAICKLTKSTYKIEGSQIFLTK